MHRVRIRIKGSLDTDWSDWFGGLTITHGEADDTILTGPVSDQTALFGLLTKVRDLGLQLISVEVDDIATAEITSESAIS